jgi:hypothetical protein
VRFDIENLGNFAQNKAEELAIGSRGDTSTKDNTSQKQHFLQVLAVTLVLCRSISSANRSSIR